MSRGKYWLFCYYSIPLLQIVRKGSIYVGYKKEGIEKHQVCQNYLNSKKYGAVIGEHKDEHILNHYDLCTK